MTGDPLIRVSLTKAFPHHESSVPAADRKTMAYFTPAGPLAFTFLSLRGTSQNVRPGAVGPPFTIKETRFRSLLSRGAV